MSAILKIICFGGLRIELNGTAISNFETDKAKALLIYLATESPRVVRRSQIAGLLWPDDSEDRALHNLRQTLSSLKKIVGDSSNQPEFILADRESIQINPNAFISVDSLEFGKSFRKAFQYYQSHNGKGLIHIRFLMQAMSLFQGEFLAHFSLSKSYLFEEWMFLKKEEYNLMAIRGFTLLSVYHEKRAEYHLAIEYLSKIVELFPWDEMARNRLIRLFAIDHQWSAAKKHYFSLKRYLEEELSVSPSEESKKLFDQICLGAEGKAIIQPEYKQVVDYIPTCHSTLVGRDCDLDEVMLWLIAPEKRLITVTGLGGIGKTHFALEIARQSVGLYQDGVFFVSLISARQGDQIVSLIAKSIGLFFTDQADNQKQLFDHLREKQACLVLDNFEHLLADENSLQFLDSLLTATKNLKILVTSREILNLVEEQVYLLSGLGYPQNSKISLSDAKMYDAICLFLQRTSQKQPRFTLNEKNIESIVRICILLEGLPLGVELAAAAICEQGCDMIAETYEHNLAALATRMSNFQMRHRSLYAAFEISWDLLSRHLQTKLAGLSNFLDGFTKEAASTIVGADSSDLVLLISKSLIRVNENGRYSLHEAIRQFVNAKQIPGFDVDGLKEKQACYFAALLGEIHSDLLSDRQTFALNLIQEEFGNLSQCWIWIIDQKRFDLLEKTMDSLYQYFSIRSLYEEGISWFKRATESKELADSKSLVMGMLLWRLGSLAYKSRDRLLALESLTESEKILSEINVKVELASCWIRLGWVYHRDKDFQKAQSFSDLALQYFTDQNNDLGLTQAYLLAGSIKNRQGKYQESLSSFERAYHLAKKTKNQRNLVTVINLLADISCHEGNYEKAIKLYQESLGISDQLNDRYYQSILLNNLGTIYHIQHDYFQARNYYEKSLAFARDIGDLDGIAFALNNLGELATWLKDYDLALNYTEEALEIATKLQENWTIIVCLNSLGETYCGKQDYQKSKTFYFDALQRAIEINSMDLAARVVINLARDYQLSGDLDMAKTLLIAGLSHSAIEQDSREKAVAWLSEMGVNETYAQNDMLLHDIFAEMVFLNKT